MVSVIRHRPFYNDAVLQSTALLLDVRRPGFCSEKCNELWELLSMNAMRVDPTQTFTGYGLNTKMWRCTRPDHDQFIEDLHCPIQRRSSELMFCRCVSIAERARRTREYQSRRKCSSPTALPASPVSASPVPASPVPASPMSASPLPLLMPDSPLPPLTPILYHQLPHPLSFDAFLRLTPDHPNSGDHGSGLTEEITDEELVDAIAAACPTPTPTPMPKPMPKPKPTPSSSPTPTSTPTPMRSPSPSVSVSSTPTPASYSSARLSDLNAVSPLSSPSPSSSSDALEQRRTSLRLPPTGKRMALNPYGSKPPKRNRPRLDDTCYKCPVCHERCHKPEITACNHAVCSLCLTNDQVDGLHSGTWVSMMCPMCQADAMPLAILPGRKMTADHVEMLLYSLRNPEDDL